jgi:histidinol-phosphate aminotransferase
MTMSRTPAQRADSLTPAPFAPDDLARPEIRGLPLYTPDQSTTRCPVDVSDNTNLWGMPPAALRALRDTPASDVARYPSLYSATLKDALRAYVGVESAGIVTGCGSDDVLDAAMRAFGAPGDAIAFSAPTFSMIPTFARVNGLESVAIPLRDSADDYDIDAEQLVAADAKLIYLCTPNNPTATAVSRSAVEYVVTHARGIVIIDEAYAEFATVTHDDLVARHERVLVARTLSKAFGLAGLRVGYGVGSPALVGLLERARGPYKVNTLAERAALAALSPGDDALGWVRAHAALARTNRVRLSDELRDLGLFALPSDANFLLVPMAGARQVGRRLQELGVLVRSLTDLPRDLAVLRQSNGEALRIGVGPWEIMRQLLDALREALR